MEDDVVVVSCTTIFVSDKSVAERFLVVFVVADDDIRRVDDDTLSSVPQSLCERG